MKVPTGAGCMMFVIFLQSMGQVPVDLKLKTVYAFLMFDGEETGLNSAHTTCVHIHALMKTEVD